MNIKELAEQAGMLFSDEWMDWAASDIQLERFAELIRQDEREACAALCDDWFAATAGQAIRERGDK